MRNVVSLGITLLLFASSYFIVQSAVLQLSELCLGNNKVHSHIYVMPFKLNICTLIGKLLKSKCILHFGHIN